jgi:hypothetical protein
MERDDLTKDHEYSLTANHDEAHGVEIRKTIWKVTAILTAITIVEVLIGAFIKQYDSTGGDNALWPYVKISFIILSVVKAAYMVLVFMDLGDVRYYFKWVIVGG